MILNNENYYSPEANMAYMSASQYKQFSRCEAAAAAILRGEWIPEYNSSALLVGGYVDAAITEDLDQWKSQHPEVFKKDGSLKADFLMADQIVQRIKNDPLFSALINGAHQVILTGEISGVPFKAKLDSLLSTEQIQAVMNQFPEAATSLSPFGCIVDLKCMRDLASQYSAEEADRIPFTQVWGYDIQGAIYQALEGHKLPFLIAAATKQSPPDIRILSINQWDLDAKLQEIAENAPRYDAIKHGFIPARRCERCAYCRETRVLKSIIDHRELDAYAS